ncbi:ABC transporter substrate-binding protein [Yinghuangia aomiensis]
MQGDHQTYVRNPGYWQPGKPYLDEVTFRTITDQQQSFNSVSTGGADMAITLDARTHPRPRTPGSTSPRWRSTAPAACCSNMAKPPFDDPRARKALALALDPDAFTKMMYDGQVVTPKSLFAATSTQIDQPPCRPAPRTRRRPPTSSDNSPRTARTSTSRCSCRPAPAAPRPPSTCSSSGT